MAKSVFRHRLRRVVLLAANESITIMFTINVVKHNQDDGGDNNGGGDDEGDGDASDGDDDDDGESGGDYCDGDDDSGDSMIQKRTPLQ